MSTDIEKVTVELARRNDFVVFAGTGVSLEAGLPTWEELLQALEKACFPQGTHKFGNPDEFPGLAQRFYDRLKSEGREEDYKAILKEQLKPRKAFSTSQELEIVETTGRIVTTNFDATFEDAIRKIAPGCTDFVQRLPVFDYSKMNRKYALTYLHGSSDDYIILKTDDYDRFYPSISKTDGSGALEDYLKHLYLNHTLVFIGCSFNDRYLKEAIRMIHRRLANDDAVHAEVVNHYIPRLESVQHYAFLQKYDQEREKERLRREEPPGTERYQEGLARIDAQLREETELDQLLETVKIKVARYVYHIDWVRCFREIRDLRKKRPGTSTILAGNEQ
jgi:hypothetical protein